MSKSLGNIVEPMEMISKYSADALRFWAAGSKLGDDLPFQEKDLLTGQKFATKLWNASKFCLLHLEDYTEKDQGDHGGLIIEVFDRWLLSKLHKVIQTSTETFDSYEYSRTKAEVEQFFWHLFCDQYLEIVKDRLYNPGLRGEEAKRSAQTTLYLTLLGILKMMAPIMPHITEEIYQLFFAEKEQKEQKKERKKSSIHLSSWPAFNVKMIDEKAELAGDVGVDIINVVRKYKSENQLSLKEEIAELVIVSEEAEFKEMIVQVQQDLKAVLNVKKITFAGETSLESEQFSFKIGIHK